MRRKDVEGRRDAPGVDPWLERFLARDGGAIRDCQSLIARIVAFRGFGAGRAEQEDLVQETMTHLWEAVGAPRFDPGRSFEAFVRTVATRRCIDWRRSRRITSELPESLPAHGQNPEGAYLARERLAMGRRLLGGLGSGCRDLIRLHTGQELTWGEIARRLNRSEGALRVQMSECLSRARQLLKAMKQETG